jgi:hypothetical protein
MTKTMAVAVGFGIVAATSLLALAVWWWRRLGGAGLAQLVAGQVIVAGVVEVDWYGADHGWHTTHHYAGFLLIPATFVGLGCICWGGVVAHSTKPMDSSAADTQS